MNIFDKDHTAFYPIILSKKDYIGNSTFRYFPPAGTINLNKSEIGLESIFIPFSWFNIRTIFNNRIFTIGFPQGASYVYNQITIPEGQYTIDQLNAWLQFYMISQNYYLIDNLGNYRYYLELVYNVVYGRVQLNLYNTPTVAEFALLTGWTNPGWSLPTVSNRRPIFVVGSSNDFGRIIGFNADNYNAESQLGQFAPENPINQVIVQTINLDNKYSQLPQNLYAFLITNETFGSIIKIEPANITYVDVTDCSVSHIDIKLVDQDYNPLDLQDVSSVLIKLNIKVREIK